MTGFKREVAHRLFARELLDTTIAFDRDPDDAYAPQFVLTPTGAKVNRIFVVGTLTEKEDIGTDTENWRIRVSDPTGAFFMYAGMYQPDATRAVTDINVPEFVAVVGKVGVYTTEDGKVRTSVKPETITVVDAATRDRWVAETAKLTLERVDALGDGRCPYSETVVENYPNGTEAYTAMAIDAMSGGE